MLLFSLVVLLFSSLSSGFTFTLDEGDLTPCGVVNVKWQGGSPPFYMTILPALDYPMNISIPTSAWNSSSSSGTYAWTITYPTGTKFAAMMSDSTGAGTGGVSELSTIGTQSPSSSCTLRSDSSDFLFYLNETAVAQCRPVEIYWDDTASAPVTILGVVPGGQPFQFESIGAATSLVWNVNIATGTQFILASFDNGSKGQGGSSALLTVGQGVDGCLDESSPSSTPAVVPPTTTQSGVSSKTGSTKTTTYAGIKTVTAITTALPTGAAGLSGATITGIAVGAVFAVLIAQGAIFFFCCRRQFAALLSHKRQMRERQVKPGPVDLISTLHPGTALSTDDLHLASERGTMPNTTRTRQSGMTYEEDGYDMQSVSPFWDANAASSPTIRHDNNVYSGPFDTPPSEAELEPPLARYDELPRNDSFTSGIRPNHGNSPSPSIGAFPSDEPLLSRRSPHPLPTSNTQTAASSSAAGSLSKAAEAAAVTQQRQGRRMMNEFGGRERPSGGFRRHEDAGRFEAAGQSEVEDLPPLYQPEWEEDSQRRS